MWYTNGDCLVILITLVVIVPLAAAKNIGFLGYTSGFAMCCMILFTGVVSFLYTNTNFSFSNVYSANKFLLKKVRQRFKISY